MPYVVPKECFPYRRIGFFMTTALLLLLSAFIIGLFLMMKAETGMMALVGALCGLIVFFYGLAPLATKHCIDEGELILSQGFFFRAKVPIASIASLGVLEQGPSRTGAYLATMKRTLYVTTRRSNLIEIKLKRPQRFAMAFGRSADTIVFDCLDVKMMVDKLESFTPASPAR